MGKKLTPRQIAGRKNGAMRGPLSPEGRAALRASATANRPWAFSTGPRSAKGKAASRRNALRHGERAIVLAPWAVSEARRLLARGIQAGDAEMVHDVLVGLACLPGIKAIILAVRVGLEHSKALRMAAES